MANPGVKKAILRSKKKKPKMTAKHKAAGKKWLSKNRKKKK